jgi:lipid-binding SYLF domain-containing protein
LDDEVELSVGLGLAAGPVGDTASIGTGGVHNVYVYSNSGGAFAGATIGGGSIKANNSINEAIYKMKGGEVLRDPGKIRTASLPSELRNFTNTLAKYSK